MSVLPDSQVKALPERDIEGDEALIFAAASIIRQMNRSTTESVSREVTCDQKSYRLEGRRLQTVTETTGPIVLVFVEPAPQLLPSEEELREQFGLSRKEVKVARLIAEGLSNEEVAVELSISPHTARHHTERVLAKLEVRSRIHVRAALLSGRVSAE